MCVFGATVCKWMTLHLCDSARHEQDAPAGAFLDRQTFGLHILVLPPRFETWLPLSGLSVKSVLPSFVV